MHKLVIPYSLVLLVTSCGRVDVDTETNHAHSELVLINLDFENETYSPWTGQYSKEGYNFDFSTASPRDGNFSGRFFVGEGDYWLSPNSGKKSARSELQLKNTAPAEREIYYSWDVKIDARYAENSDWQIIGQFHDQPDTAMGQTWSGYPANSPPLSYRYRNGTLILSVYSWAADGVIQIAKVPFSKGGWHKIITRVYWSTSENGFVEAWLDGTPIESDQGQKRYTQRNCFNNAGNYLKIGLYRSKSISSEGCVYFDNVKSGLTFESVE